MRTYDAATLSLLGSREAIAARELIWIEAVNLANGLPEGLGLCSGHEDLLLSIDGAPRQYLAVGAVLRSEAVRAATGLDVRTHQIRLAGVAPEVETLVKGYRTRFAPVEIHRILSRPGVERISGAPHRVFKGLVDKVEFPEAAPGEVAECVLDAVSETRALTSGLPFKKSQATIGTDAADQFRRYGDISGSVPVYWGELREEGSS